MIRHDQKYFFPGILAARRTGLLEALLKRYINGAANLKSEMSPAPPQGGDSQPVRMDHLKLGFLMYASMLGFCPFLLIIECLLFKKARNYMK